jgi:hypothetical protein
LLDAAPLNQLQTASKATTEENKYQSVEGSSGDAVQELLLRSDRKAR